MLTQIKNKQKQKLLYYKNKNKQKQCYSIVVNVNMFEITNIITNTKPVFYDVIITKKKHWLPFTVFQIQQEVKCFDINNTEEMICYKWGKDKRMIECFYTSKYKAMNAKLKYA